MRNFAKVHVYRSGKTTEDRGKRKREFLKGAGEESLALRNDVFEQTPRDEIKHER